MIRHLPCIGHVDVQIVAQDGHGHDKKEEVTISYDGDPSYYRIAMARGRHLRRSFISGCIASVERAT